MSLAFALSLLAAPQASPLDVVQDVFDAIAAKDEAAFTESFAPDARIRIVAPVEGGGFTDTVLSATAFAANLPGMEGDLIEEIRDPVVEIAPPLAMVFTPYTFRRDGALSHCGVDIFTMTSLDGERWVITDLTFNRSRDCGEDGYPPE